MESPRSLRHNLLPFALACLAAWGLGITPAPVRAEAGVIVVDDGSPGFHVQGPEKYWHREPIGHGGSMLWTWNNQTAVENVARWEPDLSTLPSPEGYYEVHAFVPRKNATTENAVYKIFHSEGMTERSVRQARHYDAWVSLGRYPFVLSPSPERSRLFVVLADATGEAETTKKIGFDAVRFTHKGWEKEGSERGAAPGAFTRTIEFACRFHLKDTMARHVTWIKPGILRIPMPMDTYYQRFVSLEAVPPHQRIEKDGRDNVAVFDCGRGFPEILTMKIRVQNRSVVAAPSALRRYGGNGDDRAYYATLKDKYYDLDEAALVRAVQRITRAASTSLAKVEALYRWTDGNLTHTVDLPRYKGKTFHPSWWPSYERVSQVYRARNGNCRHISELFVAMCRILGVPARLIWGITTALDLSAREGVTADHFVAEIYDPEKDRWVYVEPQGLGKKFGENQQWHVVFRADSRDAPTGLLDMVYLRHLNTWNLGHGDCMTFRVVSE